MNRRKLFESYKPEKVDPEQLAGEYTATNPWGNNGKPGPGVPVNGTDGLCNLYTFKAPGRFEPAFVKFSSIIGCDQNDNCSKPLPGSNCADDDQIFAQKRVHTCLAKPTGWDIRTSGTCRQQNGKLVPPGTVEEYFVRCNPSNPKPDISNNNKDNRCKGSLSLIVFNANIEEAGPGAFDKAWCLSDPNYIDNRIFGVEDLGQSTVVGTFPFTMETCDMRISYKGFPRQLFRVERAEYDGFRFIPNQEGVYAKIVHRQTGYILMPTLKSVNQKLSTLNPDITKPVNMYDPKLFGRDIYPWGLVSQLSDPANPKIIARSQIAYLPDPTRVPNFGDSKKIWEYLTSKNNNVVSMSPVLDNNKRILKLVPFVTVDSTLPTTPGSPDPQQLSKETAAMYVDSSIVGIIVKNPQNFDFNGPF